MLELGNTNFLTLLVESLGLVQVYQLLKLVLVFQDSLAFGNVEVVVRETHQGANQSVVPRLSRLGGNLSQIYNVFDSISEWIKEDGWGVKVNQFSGAHTVYFGSDVGYDSLSLQI